MPDLRSDGLELMIDTGGCPNYCAHCRLSGKLTRQMSHQEMRWIVEQFRELRKGDCPLFSKIDVALWCMEPDYRDDYRLLWDLENELGDVNHDRKHGGLLSVWRILRDDTYLTWVKEKGGKLCQITLFGAGATHNRFMGRPDAFRECIEVMKRLVEADITIQWLLIFTKAIIPDLESLLYLAEELRLPEKYARLGYDWRPALDVRPGGRGWHLEHLRPSSSDLNRISRSLLESDRIDWWVKDTEAECTRMFLDGKLQREDNPETLCLHVDSSFNVFPQFGQLDPWYCLGNLRRDSTMQIIENYVLDRTPGQHARFVIPPQVFAERYGDLASELLYGPRSLFDRWIRQHCMSIGDYLGIL